MKRNHFLTEMGGGGYPFALSILSGLLQGFLATDIR
jgi:hypothetical protein